MNVNELNEKVISTNALQLIALIKSYKKFD